MAEENHQQENQPASSQEEELRPLKSSTASTPSTSKTNVASMIDRTKDGNDSAGGSSNKKDQAFRLFLLFMMTAQNSSVVLVSRYTRAAVSKEDLYVINDLVMVTEIAKVRDRTINHG